METARTKGGTEWAGKKSDKKGKMPEHCVKWNK
jgi:hypothetical protein